MPLFASSLPLRLAINYGQPNFTDACIAHAPSNATILMQPVPVFALAALLVLRSADLTTEMAVMTYRLSAANIEHFLRLIIQSQ